MAKAPAEVEVLGEGAIRADISVVPSWMTSWLFVVTSTSALALEIVVSSGGPSYIAKLPITPRRKPSAGLYPMAGMMAGYSLKDVRGGACFEVSLNRLRRSLSSM